MSGRIMWRDSMATWPSFTVEVELLPWQWRLDWYRDDLDPCFRLELGPLRLELMANRKPFFPLERAKEV